MSGAWRRIYARYVDARLCPRGCGDTLREEETADGKRVACEDCDWFGPSFAHAAEIVAEP